MIMKKGYHPYVLTLNPAFSLHHLSRDRGWTAYLARQDLRSHAHCARPWVSTERTDRHLRSRSPSRDRSSIWVKEAIIAWCHVVPSRGSRTTTGVSVDRRPAEASICGSTATQRCHSRSRSSPAAGRARTGRGCWRDSRTTAFGCASRLSHHEGWPSSQPFIASVTRLGPSST